MEELNSIISILKRTPRVLESILGELPDEIIRANEGPDTWSAYDVVGHLIHGEKTDWIPRTRIILSDDANREFEPFNREAMFEESKDVQLRVMLHEFALLRESNIEVLTDFHLSSEALKLTGSHPDFGEVTLKQLLHTWAVHDLSHINQISRVIAYQFRNDVGPWKAYLGVLPD